MKHIDRYIIKLALSLLMVTVTLSCRRSSEPTTASTPAQVVRLDSIALEGDSAAFTGAGSVARVWLQIIGVDTADVSRYLASLEGKPYNGPVRAIFASTDSLAQVAGQIFSRVEALTDTTAPSTLATVVAPYNQSVVTADSILYVALNHYLGPEHDFYSYFPGYQRRLKTPERVGIDIAEAVIAERFPYQPGSKYPTALSRMAAEGAMVEAVMQVTGRSEETVLGYTPEEYQWLTENELPAWMALMDRGALFSTDPAVVETLVRPNSVTSFLHPQAPGRAGRYIGHKIVIAYLKNHPSTTLRELLSPDFYNDPKLLEKAEYAGK